MNEMPPKTRPREKRYLSLWIGRDVVDQLDKLAAQGWSRSAAADEILKNYFAGNMPG